MVRYTRSNFMVPVPEMHDMEELNAHLDQRCREELERKVLGKPACKADLLIEDQEAFRTLPERPFEPVHYLRLLERKPGALDHARPLEGWQLPACFQVLRRRLENDQDGDGTREYIRVLRLLEKHDLRALQRAVEQGLGINAHTRDAIAQFLFHARTGG